VQRTWIAIAAAVVLGCASDPANTIAPGNAGAPGIKRFLVCAPNTVIALPAELQDGTGPLRQQVDAYLQWHDREAEWLDLYESKRLWVEAVGAAKQQGSIEKTPALFAKRLSESHQFDALVMPSLIVHEARTTAGRAFWDGVDRRLRVVNPPKRIAGMNREQLGTWIAVAGRPDGNMLVTSVHVLVFSREGERIFEGRGGIDFLNEVDLARFAKKRAVDFRVRTDLPGGIDALREGIAIAFAPYLTLPEE
jgi:hypothetical protein